MFVYFTIYIYFHPATARKSATYWSMLYAWWCLPFHIQSLIRPCIPWLTFIIARPTNNMKSYPGSKKKNKYIRQPCTRYKQEILERKKQTMQQKHLASARVFIACSEYLHRRGLDTNLGLTCFLSSYQTYLGKRHPRLSQLQRIGWHWKIG